MLWYLDTASYIIIIVSAVTRGNKTRVFRVGAVPTPGLRKEHGIG
jgi:hypothetical protein